MSGIAEAISVIACVAAVVSAYRDSGAILRKIKERREKRGGLPPTRILEDELTKGGEAIEAAADEGFDHYGSAFDAGDDAAKIAILVATVEVQKSMLASLRKALEDDNENDFSDCIDATYVARLKVVKTLNELQLQRREESRKLHSEQAIPHYGSQARSSQVAQEVKANLQTNESSPEPSSRRIWLFKSQRRQSSPAVADIFSHPKPLLVDGNSRRASETSRGPNSGHVEPVSQTRQLDLPAHALTMQPPNDIRRNSQTSEDNVTSSHLAPTPKMVPNSSPGSTFCESAFLLQKSLSGELSGGLKVCNQSSAMTGENHIWVCRSKKCTFEGPAWRDRGQWRVDQTIRKAQELQFRWLFFAKSHVQQGRAKRGVRHYRCLICAFNQEDYLPILQGEGTLLTHILQHNGAEVGGILLHGPVRFGKQTVEKSTQAAFDLSFPELGLEQHPVSPASTIVGSDHASSNDLFGRPDDVNSVFDAWRDET